MLQRRRKRVERARLARVSRLTVVPIVPIVPIVFSLSLLPSFVTLALSRAERVRNS
ncbi:hypothetical protein PSP6_70040 [Paraburkholderia tropica]|nr:hypothetical protein PSP6_70040 [Paraburkholderia tropica]